MKKLKYDNYFRTKDINISVVIYASGIKLDSQEWSNGECYFVFEDEDKCIKIVKKYYADTLKLNAKTLLNAYRDLKNIIFGNRN